MIFFRSLAMPWVDVKDKLPPLECLVLVAGDYIPMDDKGFPLYGFPKASRRQYHGMSSWFWDSSQWRGTVDIRWWYESES